MVTILQSFSAITNAVTAVSDRWRVIILRADIFKIYKIENDTSKFKKLSRHPKLQLEGSF